MAVIIDKVTTAGHLLDAKFRTRALSIYIQVFYMSSHKLSLILEYDRRTSTKADYSVRSRCLSIYYINMDTTFNYYYYLKFRCRWANDCTPDFGKRLSG